MRTCAKLRCRIDATVTVALRYGDREVVVSDLTPDTDPTLVDLCREHADGLTPPIGWRIVDVRVPAAIGL
jgi:uncharacterized protein DUF3499